jgi:hypothetical protein
MGKKSSPIISRTIFFICYLLMDAAILAFLHKLSISTVHLVRTGMFLLEDIYF